MKVHKPPMEEFVLDCVRVGMRTTIPTDWASRVQLMVVAEEAGRHLGIEFRAVLDEQTLASHSLNIPAVRHVEEQVSIDLPASWWQRFKRDHMPSWFLRRWPVMVRFKILRARRTITLRQAEQVTLTTSARYTDPGNLACPDRPYTIVHRLDKERKNDS